MKAIANLMDGLVEVPVATIVQNLKTPWGRRRPAILLGTVVMTLAYVLFCFPISSQENSAANSIYLGILLTVFVSFFTLAINALFGTYAEITANDDDRLLLTNIKAAFDTIQYSIAYALIPVFILCFVFYMGMGYLASRGGNSAADNWIEQGVIQHLVW